MMQSILSSCKDIQWPPREYLWVGGVLAGSCVGYTCYNGACKTLRRRKVTAAREKRISELSERLQKWSTSVKTKISAERAEVITGLEFKDLQSRLQGGKLKPTEVLYAYQYKAAVENERLNFVTEDVLGAEKIARSLDAMDGPKPHLYGIPFSLKENFAIEGADATNGVSMFLNQPAKEDCAFVKIMKQHGAIPFIRTNLPQTTVSYDCENPLFGRTHNPHDLSRTPGGSSGGEGAAIASGGSILGFGGDLGGSIRIPSSWNGICGLKPCRQRISKLGFVEPLPGENIVPFIPGPMGRDVDALVECCKALFSEFTYELDRTVAPIDFREDVYQSKRPLRIGFYLQLEPLNATASSERAVNMAKTILEKNGHTLVPWTPPDAFSAIGEVYWKALHGDGGRTFMEFVGDDEISDVIAGGVDTYAMSVRMRKFMIALKERLMPSYWKTMLTATWGCETTYDWWNLAVAADNYREKVLGEWRELKLDAVLCPAMPCPAFKPGDPGRNFGTLTYMMIWNLLNFPAGVVPVTTVNGDDLKQPYPTDHEWHRIVSENLVGSEGLPMNAQCAAGPYDEEIVLRLMKEIETGLLELS